MKYIRTKDGRIAEERNLEPGFKRTVITIKSKRDNKELTQIVCDDLDTSLEMIAICEYCKHNKINPKDIEYETTTLFNKILKQADTIEELCDDFVSVSKYGYTKPVGDVVNLKYVKTKAKYDIEYIYGAVWTDKGLIYVAKMNEKGVFELL